MQGKYIGLIVIFINSGMLYGMEAPAQRVSFKDLSSLPSSYYYQVDVNGKNVGTLTIQVEHTFRTPGRAIIWYHSSKDPQLTSQTMTTIIEKALAHLDKKIAGSYDATIRIDGWQHMTEFLENNNDIYGTRVIEKSDLPKNAQLRISRNR